MHGRAADNMSCIGILKRNLFIYGIPVVILHSFEHIVCPFGIFLIIEGLEIGLSFRNPPLIYILDVILLYTCGIFQQNRGQFLCGRSTEYPPFKTILYQFWNQAAVINMRMGKNEVINLGWNKPPVTVQGFRIAAHALK